MYKYSLTKKFENSSLNENMKFKNSWSRNSLRMTFTCWPVSSFFFFLGKLIQRKQISCCLQRASSCSLIIWKKVARLSCLHTLVRILALPTRRRRWLLRCILKCTFFNFVCWRLPKKFNLLGWRCLILCPLTVTDQLMHRQHFDIWSRSSVVATSQSKAGADAEAKSCQENFQRNENEQSVLNAAAAVQIWFEWFWPKRLRQFWNMGQLNIHLREYIIEVTGRNAAKRFSISTEEEEVVTGLICLLMQLKQTCIKRVLCILSALSYVRISIYLQGIYQEGIFLELWRHAKVVPAEYLIINAGDHLACGGGATGLTIPWLDVKDKSQVSFFNKEFE